MNEDLPQPARLRRAIAVLPAGTWQPDGAPTITLRCADRFRRRLRMQDDTGDAFLLDLERPALLADGDGLRCEDGSIIRVCAAIEEVLEIASSTAAKAARFAWHLGNRHTPVQILADGTLRLAEDAVLAALLDGLGAAVVHRRAPFHPEPGAYATTGHAHAEHADAAQPNRH